MNGFDTAVQHTLLAAGGPTLSAFVRLLTAAVLGALVGIEREWHGRKAGFRTNILVATASALVMLLAEQLFRQDWSPGAHVQASGDVIRIIQSVMLGIGFLGTGAIRHTERGPTGLTTASGVWAMAAVGLCVGIGEYTLSFMAVALMLITLQVLAGVERRFFEHEPRQVVVRAPWTPGLPEELAAIVRAESIRLERYAYECQPGTATAEVTLFVALRPAESIRPLTEKIVAHPGWQVIQVK